MEDLRLDEMGFSGLQIWQNPKEFCYGIDAVLVADFISKNRGKGSKGIDFGTGNGAISLILSRKIQDAKILAVEVQEKVANLAKKNVELNHLQSKIEVLNMDILSIPDKLNEKMDFVFSNPPYMLGGAGLTNTNSVKRIARHETTASLYDFMKKGRKLLREKGDFYMVHRPSRLVDIISFGRELKLEAKTIRFVSPKIGEKPNIVLLHFVKNGGRELNILPELYVYNEDNSYSDEIDEIYER